ncbi:phosphoinositide 3-kinase regulatory subunit 5 isoform X1 [Aquila chrysaetos chrysaetos]|nr:phosphoinositide 3-kinase regulatory subunit 5 isoform X1 [Aquila chrysaetos chrysaetos]XP_029871795.1 phosphoinositide 3-kinase regulatory subunit 5 isoform X1 [Aquila chrysaetos chrysaetos]XP_029871796.1 phosphoinositide 3-kinase regulatory subunit 5 isoform X1 [Aquila chrysaetos chrysaetos]XP_029871797.1 phosphoinositide 3-kinase regulatory subunit 5 isoform X1 [Aquila chrysaetos chrysaetos]XP_029871798.1 phosphoinositide 3-kinase regulatory subunit 5 isoform X1 [Aquila chrysaetos chrysae
MQHTTCTEDRIYHALERCLHGLSRDAVSSRWAAGLCLNCWSLQELVSRDAGNYLILVEKILSKAKEVQEKCDYDLVMPLALLFYYAVLYAPHFPPGSDLLLKAASIYHSFLTWPVPYCDIFRELLTFISNELKAPGISFQRLVRTEQGLPVKNYQSSTVTVLLLNRSEVQSEFLSIAEKLSASEHPQRATLVVLLEHLYQANFGTRCDLDSLHHLLKSKTLEELSEIYASAADAQEIAATSSDPVLAREQLQSVLRDIAGAASFPAIAGEAQPRKLHTIPIPTARCYTYSWDQDNFDILNDVLSKECSVVEPMASENEEDEEEEEEVETDGCFPERDSLLSPIRAISKDSVYSALSEEGSKPSRMSLFTTSKDSISELTVVSRKSLKSFVSSLKDCMDSGYAEDSDESSLDMVGRSELKVEKTHHKYRHTLTNKIYKLFKSKSQLVLRRDLKDCPDMGSLSLPLRRAESLCTPQAKHRVPARSRRAHSLPQHVLSQRLPASLAPRHLSLHRRPFLSYDEDAKVSTLRVVVFGSDRISGKVARAYSNLRLKESTCPSLTRYFKLQFFYVPVKRSCLAPSTPLMHPSPSPGDPQLRASAQTDPTLSGMESSTNDVSHYIGMLDPWYERNVLGLMNLPMNVLCQSAKPEAEPQEDSQEQLPILADMILYYCRFATRPVLLQLYQTELTFIGGEKMTEVFIHSLELGHSAATRAIKASGPGSKRLGIDGDREAIPLTLQIAYSKTAISGRSHWNDVEKVCTSVNLSKACKKYEELASKTECLNLTMTEVVKRQNSKSKKSFNQQISVSQIKVDKVQIIGLQSSFAVCLDQDEQKILQSVTRCEISVCYKPRDSDLFALRRSSLPLQDPSEFHSLLCLPIATFSGALP